MDTLHQRIIDFDNLMAAYYEARKGKRYRHEVVRYHANLEENILNLHNHLVWKSWQPKEPRTFTVLEPKMRQITAPPFEDRIVHHALVRQVTPFFERRFIYHSYACVKDRGAHKAVKNLQSALRRMRRKHGGSVYVVQADISKYFASIGHGALIGQIARTIHCNDALVLWQKIIKAYGFGGSNRGLPVGALTSQLAANINLDPIDHAMTDDYGAEFYARYMDDIIILCSSKHEAQETLIRLRLLIESIGLTLNPKTQIRQARQGVDWCGYRTWSTHILPRKRNIKRMRKQLRKERRRYNLGLSSAKQAREKVTSMLAYTKHCDAHKTVSKILEENALCRSSSAQMAA